MSKETTNLLQQLGINYFVDALIALGKRFSGAIFINKNTKGTQPIILYSKVVSFSPTLWNKKS